MAKLLVIEDDKELADHISDLLKFEQYNVDTVYNGRDAKDYLKHYEFDVIVMDWNLPDSDGIDILREYRSIGGNAPVLMLTGKGKSSEKETGLDAGADDYLVKPFDPRELAARVRALLRRPKAFAGTIIKGGSLVIDTKSHRVTDGDKDIQLNPLEFALLEFLMRHQKQVFSPEALLNCVWGTTSDASIDSLRTYIKTLRKKIDAPSGRSRIATVHGLGYKFDPDEDK